MINKIYKNIKNGFNYVVIDSCLVKVNENWEEGVIYKRVGEYKSYVRTIQNFNDKFILHNMENTITTLTP